MEDSPDASALWDVTNAGRTSAIEHFVHETEKTGLGSGRKSTYVPMMQTADLRKGDHLPHLGRLDRTRLRTIVAQ